MNHAAHNRLVSFIWSIADDCLRDVYVRGKHPHRIQNRPDQRRCHWQN